MRLASILAKISREETFSDSDWNDIVSMVFDAAVWLYQNSRIESTPSTPQVNLQQKSSRKKRKKTKEWFDSAGRYSPPPKQEAKLLDRFCRRNRFRWWGGKTPLVTVLKCIVIAKCHRSVHTIEATSLECDMKKHRHPSLRLEMAKRRTLWSSVCSSA